MRKFLLFILPWAVAVMKGQCVYTCGNYAVSPITFSTFPTGNVNVVPTLTNPVLGTWADDGQTGPIPIGFNFEFFCSTYSDVYICSNGFITFVPISWPTQYVHPTQSIPDPTTPNGMVAFNMVDLDPSAGGTITYTTVGSAPNRLFVVTYSNVPLWGQSDLNTGQIVLRETSNIIEIHTKEAMYHLSQNPGSTQGIEDHNGTAAAYPPGRNANKVWNANGAADNTAYQFSPYSAQAIGAITGNTTLCEGDPASYIVPNTAGALSYNWFPPQTWTGISGTASAQTYTVGATGVLSVSANYTCGASPVSTLNVMVLPAPVVNLTSVSPAIICSGKTVAINVSGATNYTVQPGNLTGTGPIIVDMPMTSTQYTLYGTDQNGCNSLNTSTQSILVLESPTVTVNSGSICLGETFTINATGADSYQYSSIFSQVTPQNSGTYIYTVTGTSLSNGCVSEPALSTVTAYSLPVITANATRKIICARETTTLTVFGASTYSWSHTTETGTSLVVTPTLSTSYVVKGFTDAGCSRSATISVIVNQCVGLEENSQSVFKLYPNPSTGHLVVESELPERIFVIDILGRTVHSQDLEAGTNYLELETLAPGKYFLKGEKRTNAAGFVIISH